MKHLVYICNKLSVMRKSVIIGLLFLTSLISFSQPGDNLDYIVLDQYERNETLARMSVTLLPGFTTEGHDIFEAYVDPLLCIGGYSSSELLLISSVDDDSDGTVSNNRLEKYEKALKIEIYPNPVISIATLTYTTHNLTNVLIRIFNSQGQLVELIHQHEDKGEQKVTWDSNGFPPGVYFVFVETKEFCTRGKIVKMK